MRLAGLWQIIVLVTTNDEESPKWPADPGERGREMSRRGVIGGRRPGSGRPRTDRFSRAIAMALEPHVDEVVAAVRAGLADPNPRTKVLAARAAIDLAVRHDGVAQRDEAEEAQPFAAGWSIEEVHRAAAAVMADMVRSGEIGLDDLQARLGTAGVVDAEVVEPG